MHRTEGDNYTTVGTDKRFTDGPPGTTVTDDWLNAVQEEIATVVEGAGLTLSTASADTFGQLLAALQTGTLNKATAAEIMTGSNDAKFATPLGLRTNSASFYPSKSSVIIDYTMLVTDTGIIKELGATAVADRTFTLPSVDSDDDGLILRCANDSGYVLTIAPSDSDIVWNSGAGYGIELPDKGTMVSLRYDDNNTKWDIIEKVGGQVRIEGLKLMFPMTWMGMPDAVQTANRGRMYDDTDRHIANVLNDTGIQLTSDAKFSPSCTSFDGTGDYMSIEDSTDWDIFGTQTGHKTFAAWVWNDDAAGARSGITGQWEDGNNHWYLERNAAGNLRLFLDDDGGGAIDFTGGAIPQNDWTHVAIVFNGAKVGLYVDGVQKAYVATFLTGTVDGPFYAGYLPVAGTYWDGKMQDFHLSYNNPYGADPNVGVTDTFTEPTAPFQGVMK